MPGRNGTGPLGDGSPGRGLGTCGRGRWNLTSAKSNVKAGDRSLLESGAELIAYLLRSIITKRLNNRRR